MAKIDNPEVIGAREAICHVEGSRDISYCFGPRGEEVRSSDPAAAGDSARNDKDDIRRLSHVSSEGLLSTYPGPCIHGAGIIAHLALRPTRDRDRVEGRED